MSELTITAKYEIFTTTAVTALYLTSFSMRKTLQKRNEELFKAKEKAEESDKMNYPAASRRGIRRVLTE